MGLRFKPWLISEPVCRDVILGGLNVCYASTRYTGQGAGDPAVTKPRPDSKLMEPDNPVPRPSLVANPAGPSAQPLMTPSAPLLPGGMPPGTRASGWTVHTPRKERETHHKRDILLCVWPVSPSAPSALFTEAGNVQIHLLIKYGPS